MLVSPLSIDMYLPAFPQTAKALGTRAADLSLTISSYFLGLAAGQFFYGPLVDRYGRKGPFYVGAFLYILAALGCTEAKTLQEMIGLRVLQSLGGGVAGVVAIAMVRDFFPV